MLGERLNIDWLEARVDDLVATNRWQRMAAQAVAEELLHLRRRIAERVFAGAGGRDPEAETERYLEANRRTYERLVRVTRKLALEGSIDLASIVVAVSMLRTLA